VVKSQTGAIREPEPDRRAGGSESDRLPEWICPRPQTPITRVTDATHDHAASARVV